MHNSSASQFRGLTPWRFHDATDSTATAPVSIAAVLIHVNTGEEILLDILCNDESFATVCNSIRRFYDRNWGIYETWVISGSPAEFEPIAA